MSVTLSSSDLAPFESRLRDANGQVVRRYPGESAKRQPIHTYYVGAHTYRAGLIRELGNDALALWRECAGAPEAVADVLGVSESLAQKIIPRVHAKLASNPVEDLRIDFEDGYGSRSDVEEDADISRVIGQLLASRTEKEKPSILGIRIKPLNEDLRVRSLRTLDRFLTEWVEQNVANVVPEFVINLAKVTHPAQVRVLSEILTTLEKRLGIAKPIPIEIMIEVTQALLDLDGRVGIFDLVGAAEGRCVAAHLGVYDYTTSYGVTAAHQHMRHPACDFARHLLKAALAGTGVWLSDGATHLLPVARHAGKSLTPTQELENAAGIHRAWKTNATDIRHSLTLGFYQGWDMHPGHLPMRFAANFAFYLEALPSAAERMKLFLAKVTQASVHSGVFDDAATGQALLNFFLRGYRSGALTQDEVENTGLRIEEINAGSFSAILRARTQS